LYNIQIQYLASDKSTFLLSKAELSYW